MVRKKSQVDLRVKFVREKTNFEIRSVTQFSDLEYRKSNESVLIMIKFCKGIRSFTKICCNYALIYLSQMDE